MELSTEVDGRFGQNEDIDIDFDLTEDQHQDEADEDMTEVFEGQSDQFIGNAQDPFEGADALMEDDRSSVHDEEIQDADVTEPHIEEAFIADDPVDDLREMPQDQVIEFQEARNTLTEPSQDYTYRNASPNINDIQTKSEEKAQVTRREATFGKGPDHSPASLDLEEPLRVESQTENSDQNGQAAEPAGNNTQEVPTLLGNEAQDSQDKGVPHLDADTQESIDESASIPEEIVLQPTSNIHPIVVTYQDTEMSLFPPFRQDQENSQTFLLQDEQLANEDFQILLGACRAVLGDSIGVGNELEIAIDDLNLHISESAAESPDCTLAQLVALYVQLHHNDGEQNAPPLYVQLYTKTRFSSRWNYLLSVLEEGKGFSQVRPVDDSKHEEAEEYRQYDVENGGDTTDELANGVAVALEGLSGDTEQEAVATDNEAQLHTSRLAGLVATHTVKPNLESCMQAQQVDALLETDTTAHYKTARQVGNSLNQDAQAREDVGEEDIEERTPLSLAFYPAYGRDDGDSEHKNILNGATQEDAPNSPTDSSTLQGDNDISVQANAGGDVLFPHPASIANVSSKIAEKITQDDLGDYGEDEHEFGDQEEARSAPEHAQASRSQTDISANEPSRAARTEDYTERTDFADNDDDALITSSDADLDQEDGHDLPEEAAEHGGSFQVQPRVQKDDEVDEIDPLDHARPDNLKAEIASPGNTDVDDERKVHGHLQQIALGPVNEGESDRDNIQQPNSNLIQGAQGFSGEELRDEDDDEITRGGEDEQDDLSIIPIAEQNASSSSESLKRLRSRSEEDFAEDSNAKGELDLLAGW
ncbi:MAG: hypothetical protein Q9217_003086 [Psora testacea]